MLKIGSLIYIVFKQLKKNAFIYLDVIRKGTQRDYGETLHIMDSSAICNDSRLLTYVKACNESYIKTNPTKMEIHHTERY